MNKAIAVCGTFDTKGEEFSYLIDQLHSFGFDVVSVDMGCQETNFSATYPASVVAEVLVGKIREAKSVAEKLEVMADGAAQIVSELVRQKKVGGVICMAGGRGTYMSCRVLRRMPVGLPKLLISTCATNEGIQFYFAGINDTMVINPLVDVSGLNPILRTVIRESAACICGMVNNDCTLELDQERIRVGITMWGVTTPCVNHVRKILEDHGYEVLVFHANGLGGSTMDKLVEQGYIDVVADLTLSEITQPICKNQFDDANATNRMKNACRTGVPQVVTFGGIDMVIHPAQEADSVCKGRKIYHHTAECVFYRSNAEEAERCVKYVADRLKQSTGKVTVMLPLQGTSAVNKKGEVLFDADANQALVNAVDKYMKPDIPVIHVDAHINDEAFAREVAAMIINYAEESKTQ